jgi:hypothetical protein
MMESTYDVLTRLWRDNNAEIQRIQYARDQEGYINGLMSANARIRAAMAGMPRSEPPPAPELQTGPGLEPTEAANEPAPFTIDAEPEDDVGHTMGRLTS